MIDESSPSFSPLADFDPALWKLIREFVRALPDRLREIDVAFEGRRWQDLHMAAHRLKGVGASFGFPELTEVAGAFKDSLSAAAVRFARERLAHGSILPEERPRFRQLVDYPLPNPLLERLSLSGPLHNDFNAFALALDIPARFDALRACLQGLGAPDPG